MAKYRKYNQNQTFLHAIDPEVIRKNNPLWAAVDEFVDRNVSMEAFEGKIKNEQRGAPTVHPKMMLKILLYSYASGVHTSREIEERMEWDVNYLALSGQQKVDHSTICDFLLKYSDEFVEIYAKLSYLLVSSGLAGMNLVGIDGTKIQANANKEFNGTLKDFQDRREKIEEKIRETIEGIQEEKAEKYRLRKEEKLKQMQRYREKLVEFLEGAKEEESYDPKISRNLTDPDARLMKDQERIYAGYNAQIAVDDKHHLIVAAEVFNESNDVHMLRPMVEKIRQQTGEDLKATEIVTDAGYWTLDNLEFIDNEQLNVFLPEGRGPNKEKKLSNDTINIRHCQIEIKGDLVKAICPAGQVMTAREPITTSRQRYYQFLPDPVYCLPCPFRARCYKHVKNSFKKFLLNAKYLKLLPIKKKMIDLVSSVEGKKRMADRSCLVEHIFGEIKQWMKFRRFFHRGLKKVRIIWLLICLAYNLKKLAWLGISP